jgi:hypothetical protein
MLQITLCYEVGYDGFWLARPLLKLGIRTVVFDPSTFLKPRRRRLAKTDRLDAGAAEHVAHIGRHGATVVPDVTNLLEMGPRPDPDA